MSAGDWMWFSALSFGMALGCLCQAVLPLSAGASVLGIFVYGSLAWYANRRGKQ